MINRIVGGVAGGVLLCLLLAIICVVCAVCIIKVRKNRKVEQFDPNTGQPTQPVETFELNTTPTEHVSETTTDPSFTALHDMEKETELTFNDTDK